MNNNNITNEDKKLLYYKTLGILNNNNKILKNEELIKNLFDKVKKPKNETYLSKIEKNYVHQADLLFMPFHNDYKYALVISDLGSRMTDAEPIKNKESNTIIKAFKTIYNRKILDFPKSMIQTDAGKEFNNNDVITFFKNNGIAMRFGKVGRHRMQSVVEAKNGIIARALFFRMTAEELETGQKAIEWVKFLPLVIKYMNERFKINNKDLNKDISNKPVRVDINDNEHILIPEGTRVRVMLDEPIDIYNGRKVGNKFRATDIRYENDITTVKQILLRPDQPPMYLTNKYPHVPYLKNHLQVVGNIEKRPNEIIKRLVINNILEKKKENNKIYYLVKFAGNPNNTWIARTRLIIDFPDEIKEYEKINK